MQTDYQTEAIYFADALEEQGWSSLIPDNARQARAPPSRGPCAARRVSGEAQPQLPYVGTSQRVVDPTSHPRTHL